VKPPLKPRRRYGTGCLYLVRRFWYVKFREVTHSDHITGKVYKQHVISTKLTKREDAERFLEKLIAETKRRQQASVQVRLRSHSWESLRSDQKLRYEALSHYCGGLPRCQCPGCTTVFFGFLQIDHEDGDGAKHVGTNGGRLSGKGLWKWLKANNYPDGFQVLCCNCNGVGGKRNFKHCPMSGQAH
jgi:hypothetical protein